MSHRQTASRIACVTALVLGCVLMTAPSPSGSDTRTSPTAEFVEATERGTGAPAGVLWRGVAVLATGAVVSTAAYAVAMRRSRARAESGNFAVPEAGIAQEALEDIETLAELGSDKAAHVLKEWLEESTHL